MWEFESLIPSQLKEPESPAFKRISGSSSFYGNNCSRWTLREFPGGFFSAKCRQGGRPARRTPSAIPLAPEASRRRVNREHGTGSYGAPARATLAAAGSANSRSLSRATHWVRGAAAPRTPPGASAPGGPGGAQRHPPRIRGGRGRKSPPALPDREAVGETG